MLSQRAYHNGKDHKQSGVAFMRQGLCPHCLVHQRICVCDICAPIAGAPTLWALQHPSETGHSKGTLRVASACLPDLRVEVGECPDDFDELRKRAVQGGLALLFPSSGSKPLETADISSIHEWLVIDGTWRKANRIWLSNPWLQALPCYNFHVPPASVYKVRKAPRQDSVSTAEAISHLLHLTHPELDLGPLQRGMQALVDRQLANMPVEARRHYLAPSRNGSF